MTFKVIKIFIMQLMFSIICGLVLHVNIPHLDGYSRETLRTSRLV